MSEDKVRDIMKISQEPVSLETPIGEEEDNHLGDFISDRRAGACRIGGVYPSEGTAHDVLDTLTQGRKGASPEVRAG